MKFLHVGCGSKDKSKTTGEFKKEDWTEIRYDIDESVSPDVVGSMTNMDCIDSNSVDAVYSSHNIEHLYPHEVGLALKEFYRVLSYDGFVMLTCPDLQSVCKVVAEDKLLDTLYVSAAGPISPIDILYGHRAAMARGNLYMAHRSGFTLKALIGSFRQAGFQSCIGARRESHFDLFCIATKNVLEKKELEDLAMAHFPK